MKNKELYITVLMDLYKEMCDISRYDHDRGERKVFSETMKHNLVSIINKLNNR